MKYNTAPIIEAIFDIRVKSLKNVSVEQLEKTHQSLKEFYPDKNKQINFTGKIELKDEIEFEQVSESETRGFIFSNADKSRQVQIRVDGFTYNMLKPYSDWEEFSKEALRLWKIYYETFNPKEVNRIALRYINKINLPLPVDSFQDYITNIPPIPKNLPQTFQNFFMQIEVPCEEQNTNITISETIEKPTTEVLPLILDIDVYKKYQFNNDVEELKKDFQKLREIKNNTFESCITEKSRNLFT